MDVTWAQTTGYPRNGRWNDLAWNGTVYLAVSIGGRPTSISSSPDGEVWTVLTNAPYLGGTQPRIRAINGVFYLFSFDTNMTGIYRSADHGASWTVVTLANAAWSDIAGGGGRLVAIGRAATNNVAYSTDNGLTWTSRTVSNYYWTCIAWNGAVFCASSHGSSSYTITSADGITWSGLVNSFAGYWDSMAASPSGLFVRVASFQNRIKTSPDGVVWTERTALATTGSLIKVVHTGAQFIVMTSGDAQVGTSYNGIDWSIRTLPVSGSWAGMAVGIGQIVMIGRYDMRAVTSSTGLVWALGGYVYGNEQCSITEVAGGFVAASYLTKNVFHSTNLAQWTPVAMPVIEAKYHDMYSNWALDSASFLAAGVSNSTSLYRTVDGLSFAVVNVGIPVQEIIEVGGRMFATGSVTSAAYSDDAGLTWVVVPNAFASVNWYFLAGGNGKVVAAQTYTANFATSSDNGLTWVQGTFPGLIGNVIGLAFNGTVFCAITKTQSFVSTDGVTWTMRTAFPGNTYTCSPKMHVARNEFVFLSYQQNRFSKDGIDWTVAPAPWLGGSYYPDVTYMPRADKFIGDVSFFSAYIGTINAFWSGLIGCGEIR